MKFSCPKCATRYSIAEEKVPAAKTLRFSCKKCGNVIRLRRKPAKATAPKEAQSTRITSPAEVKAMHEQAKAPPPPPRDSMVEWHVLIAGEQKGPISEDDLRELLKERQVDRRSYAWRDGMKDWTRLGEISEFEELAQSVGDASWRIVTPVEHANQSGTLSPEPPSSVPEPTQAIDRRVLEEAIAQTQRPTENLVKELKTKLTGEEEPLPTSTPKPAISAPEVEEENVVQAETSEDSQSAPLVDDTNLDSDFDDQLDASAKPTATAEPTAAFFIPLDAIPSKEEAAGGESDPAEETLESNKGPNFPSTDSSILEAAAAFAGKGDELSAAQPSSLSEGPGTDSQPLFKSPENEGQPSVVTAPVTVNQSPKDSAPGETTRVFMASAGLYKRQRNHKIAIGLVASFVVLVGTVFYLDTAGIWQLPGLGIVYEKTGIADPNAERAIKRVKTKLATSKLNEEERDALRRKLLGLDRKAKRKRKRTQEPKHASTVQEVIQDPNKLSKNKRDMMTDLFSDNRKKEAQISLQKPEEIQAPNLPDGLTKEAILQVISNNSLSIKLCMDQALRKGEELKGRMDVEITIAPTGSVNAVSIVTTRFQNSTIGRCSRKRIKLWRFPPFNGQEVPVQFPYVLSSGI